MPGPSRLAADPPHIDLIVVLGGAPETLDLLRLASVRSDDIMLVTEVIDVPTRRFVDHFAIDLRQRSVSEQDIAGATAVLVALGDVDLENRIVRKARRHGIPLHVAGRPLVSDFTMLDLVERKDVTFARRSLRPQPPPAAA